jgi:hypothetical protein
MGANNPHYIRYREAQRAYYQEHKAELGEKRRQRYRDMAPEERSLYHFRDRLKRCYGISVEQYEEMLDRQGGVCGLCGEPPRGLRLAVDHDHETGRVRGLLHNECNRALGTWERINGAALVYLGEQA